MRGGPDGPSSCYCSTTDFGIALTWRIAPGGLFDREKTADVIAHQDFVQARLVHASILAGFNKGQYLLRRAAEQGTPPQGAKGFSADGSRTK